MIELLLAKLGWAALVEIVKDAAEAVAARWLRAKASVKKRLGRSRR